MKKIYLSMVFLLIPLIIYAQYKVDGRRVWPETISTTQIVNGTVANADLASTAVDGGVMLEATEIVGWFPVSFDSSTTSGDVFGTHGWKLDATYPPSPTYWGGWQVFGFDADDGGSTGDDAVYLQFVMPFDYDEGGLEFYLYWFHTDKDGAATDSVEWDLSLHMMGNADTLIHTDSTLAVVYDVATKADSNLYIVNIDPETSSGSKDITYTYGDLVRVKIWVDENGNPGSGNGLDSGELAYLIGVLVTAEKRDD